jgi:hypothetical protein
MVARSRVLRPSGGLSCGPRRRFPVGRTAFRADRSGRLARLTCPGRVRDRPSALRCAVTFGLCRPATRPQPDGNAGGFCSFCAADRRPPEAKEHSHEDATESGDQGSRPGAGDVRLRRCCEHLRRDISGCCECGVSAARAGGHRVCRSEGHGPGEAGRRMESRGARPGACWTAGRAWRRSAGPVVRWRPGGMRITVGRSPGCRQ